MRDELHFLILHYLSSTPCTGTAAAFEREALEHGRRLYKLQYRPIARKRLVW